MLSCWQGFVCSEDVFGFVVTLLVLVASFLPGNSQQQQAMGRRKTDQLKKSQQATIPPQGTKKKAKKDAAHKPPSEPQEDTPNRRGRSATRTASTPSSTQPARRLDVEEEADGVEKSIRSAEKRKASGRCGRSGKCRVIVTSSVGPSMTMEMCWFGGACVKVLRTDVMSFHT